MKAKYIVIILLIALLAFSIRSLLRIENRIRAEKIKYVTVVDEERALFTSVSFDELKKISEQCDYYFISEGDYFKVLNPEKDYNSRWEDIFFKGVNIGTAVPGKFPTEFSLTFNEYLEWFHLISNMNSNVIRIYTILPPDFYQALLVHNQMHHSKKIYLFQGVWTELPDKGNFYNNDFKQNFQEEIMHAVDVIHGKAVIREKRGHASGVYSSDISRYVAGILIGREWEPDAVEKTNRLNKQTSFNGNFISVHQGNAMEVWLGEIMDFAIHYETQTYKAQHPVAFVNWLPLDPMYHNSEFIDAEYVREYDNDLEYLDFRHFHSSDLYKSGFFASYHVYPYYPDFIYNEPKYADSIKADGQKDNFYFYLLDLKNNHKDIPLLISEYGLPSSRGNSHQTPIGFDQGGHSEKEQADFSVTLTQDIHQSRCAGAIYFEWIDEWFKYNWLVMDYERPSENRRLWHNLENPEQNYGILAYESRTKTIDGKTNDWTGFNKSDKAKIQFASDPGYFYMLAYLPDFDFKKNNFYVAIDVFDTKKGDFLLPYLNYKSDIGVEFMGVFKNTAYAELLVDDFYALYNEKAKSTLQTCSSVKNDNGIFISQTLMANRKRESVTGDVFKEMTHNRGILKQGNSSLDSLSNSDWYWNPETKILEVRLTWQLLNISDPSTHSVLNNINENSDIGTSKTDGFNMLIFITDKKNKILMKYPVKNHFEYIWDEWYEPTYQKRLKPLYKSLQKEFLTLHPFKNKTEKEIEGEHFSFTSLKNGATGAVALVFKDNEKSLESIILPCLETFRTKAAFIISEGISNQENRINLEIPLDVIKKIKNQKHELVFETDFETNSGQINANNLKYKKNLFEMLTSFKVKSIWNNSYPLALFDQSLLLKADLNVLISGKTILGFGNILRLNSIENIDNYKKTDSVLKVDKGIYMTPFIRSFEQPKGSGALKLSNASAKLHRIIRIFRNNGYWLTTPTELMVYSSLVKNAKIVNKTYKNVTFVTLLTDNKHYLPNYPVNVIYKSNAKKIRVVNSADDGYYNLRDGQVMLSFFPNKEVSIEIITL